MKSKKPFNYLLHFDEQVASDLEFDVVRAMLAEKCNQPTAEARAHALRPRKDRKAIVRLLEETEELRRMRTEGVPFPLISRSWKRRFRCWK